MDYASLSANMDAANSLEIELQCKQLFQQNARAFRQPSRVTNRTAFFQSMGIDPHSERADELWRAYLKTIRQESGASTQKPEPKRLPQLRQDHYEDFRYDDIDAQSDFDEEEEEEQSYEPTSKPKPFAIADLLFDSAEEQEWEHLFASMILAEDENGAELAKGYDENDATTERPSVVVRPDDDLVSVQATDFDLVSEQPTVDDSWSVLEDENETCSEWTLAQGESAHGTFKGALLMTTGEPQSIKKTSSRKQGSQNQMNKSPTLPTIGEDAFDYVGHFEDEKSFTMTKNRRGRRSKKMYGSRLH